MSDEKSETVAIIGAGLGALCLALDLQRKGFYDYVIYERDDAVGGTWNNNRYPGCRCDIGAILYSHSRHLNPEWKETHPPRAVIQKYLSDAQGITPRVRFGHEFVKASWNSAQNAYDITLRNGSGVFEVRHQLLVSAIGGFSVPLYPNVPGLETYKKGKVLHTLTWPRELESAEAFRGKEVLVVGNGCSGVQLVSALGRDPEVKVIAMARSQHWLAPSPIPEQPHSTPFTALDKWLHRTPFFYRIIRILTYCKTDIAYLIIRPGSAWLRKMIEKRIGAWMNNRAPAELKGRMVPDFPYGAKRLVFDGGYMNALSADNVTPVWDSLASATEYNVFTASGKTFAPDYVALATGFDTSIGLTIQGRDGYSTGPDRSHIEQYHGTATPGFPNFFTILGANTAPGVFSVTFHLEVQADYVSECIVQMQKKGVKTMEVKQEASDRYNKWLDRRLEKSIWNTVKTYFRQDGGTGKVFTHFPGPGALFWWINYGVKWDDYIGAEPMGRDQRTKRRATTLGLMMLLGAMMWRLAA